jgi:methionyl-tRNA formyltransferase
VAATAATPIGPDENAGELALRLAGMTAELVARVVDAIAEDRVTWTPQDSARASFAPKLERAEAELDWSQPATTLARRVRGFAPRPGAFTHLAGEPLRILAATALPGPVDRAPGRVRVGGDPPLRVATGDGWLAPRVLQRAGRRPLDVEEFLRGHPLPDATQLGGKPPVATLVAGREPT